MAIDTSSILSNPDSNLSLENFKFMANLIYEQAGIYLDGNKRVMVQSRILRRLKQLNLKTVDEYIAYLKANPKTEMEGFINALTTNKTDFFRENEHFNYIINTYFTESIANRTTSLAHNIYVWSAACSAGHEVYTLALIFDEFCKQNTGFNYKILGTDIDTDILEKAKTGIYPADQVAAIPSKYLPGNFDKGRGASEGYYRVSDYLRRNIKFRKFNLTAEDEKIPIEFDIIFLRNVLIYFPPVIIKRVIDKLVAHLKPGGLLFIGHSETLNNIEHDLEFIGSSTYRKKR